MLAFVLASLIISVAGAPALNVGVAPVIDASMDALPPLGWWSNHGHSHPNWLSALFSHQHTHTKVHGHHTPVSSSSNVVTVSQTESPVTATTSTAPPASYPSASSMPSAPASSSLSAAPPSSPAAPSSPPAAPSSSPAAPSSPPAAPSSSPAAPSSPPAAPSSSPAAPSSPPAAPSSPPAAPSSSPAAPSSPPAAPSSPPAAPSSPPAAPPQSVTSQTSASASPTSAPLPPSVAAYLEPHNALRAKHSAAPLTWSEDLANAAKAWASKCKWAHSAGAVGNFGENIAAGTGNFDAKSAVAAWASEESQYDPNHPTYSHFTQMVWKATTQLGCSVVTCPGLINSDVSQFHVCEYSAPGNVEGQSAMNVS